MESTLRETIEDVVVGILNQPSQLALRRAKKQGSNTVYLKAVPQRTLTLTLEGYVILLDNSPDFSKPRVVNYVPCMKKYKHKSVHVTNPHDLTKITMLNALYEMNDIGEKANQMGLNICPPVSEMEATIYRLETHLNAKYNV